MKEYTQKTDNDLHALVAEKREAIRSFRFGIAGGKAKNLKEAKGHRKEIARMLTTLNSRKNKTA